MHDLTEKHQRREKTERFYIGYDQTNIFHLQKRRQKGEILKTNDRKRKLQYNPIKLSKGYNRRM